MEINVKLLLRYPLSPLCSYAQSPGSNPVFLDYNPYAFLVVLDYLRTNQVCIPRNVSTNLVKIVFDELRIDLPEFIETETYASLPNVNEPPPYTQNPTSSIAKPTIGFKLDNHQQILYNRLEPLMFGSIFPLLTSQFNLGHTQLKLAIIPPTIDPTKNASDLITEDVGYVKSYYSLKKGDPDLPFLIQPKVTELMEKILRYGSMDLKFVQIYVKNITLRLENAFGLLESKNTNILEMTLHLK
ncbi:hypothetical protein HK103_005498 [Boothiomyces macroporosus]|uniref:Potassium channel tetramerisation-type BTB domain-containing protein n=1 Tax=Boothiomyces macroporosus TaxID=261099 RepID=A0AAD5UF44_9FUNG|nr:hypothetical protein HK103_005498 [Boothiomyces macroporosus]